MSDLRSLAIEVQHVDSERDGVVLQAARTTRNVPTSTSSVKFGDVDQAAEIKKMWRIFRLDSSGVLQLRALAPKGIKTDLKVRNEYFRASDYSSLEDCKRGFETRALKLNESGYNVYIVMNPIKSEFSGGAASDGDIFCRRLLLIDIDRADKKIQPSNQAELDAAQTLALQIKAFLAQRAFSAPTMVMSGNGYHLYYGLADLSNTELEAEVVRATLHALSRTFDNAVVGVDTAVYNASRITKVPGTVMRKGVPADDRPYRVAVVCDEE